MGESGSGFYLHVGNKEKNKTLEYLKNRESKSGLSPRQKVKVKVGLVNGEHEKSKTFGTSTKN